MTAQSAPRDDFYRRMSAQEYRGFASGGQKAPHEAAMKNASVPYQTRMEMRPPHRRAGKGGAYAHARGKRRDINGGERRFQQKC